MQKKVIYIEIPGELHQSRWTISSSIHINFLKRQNIFFIYTSGLKYLNASTDNSLNYTRVFPIFNCMEKKDGSNILTTGVIWKQQKIYCSHTWYFTDNV